eukprot:scaffold682_cov363-Pavlova_lutheri.AAC.40
MFACGPIHRSENPKRRDRERTGVNWRIVRSFRPTDGRNPSRCTEDPMMRMTPTQVPSSKHDHFSSRNGASISVPLALAQVFCFSLDRDLPRGSQGNLHSIGLPGLAMEIAIGHSSFACAPEHARQDHLVGSTPLRTCTRIPSLRYNGPAGTSLPECWIDVTYETVVGMAPCHVEDWRFQPALTSSSHRSLPLPSF